MEFVIKKNYFVFHYFILLFSFFHTGYVFHNQRIFPNLALKSNLQTALIRQKKRDYHRKLFIQLWVAIPLFISYLNFILKLTNGIFFICRIFINLFNFNIILILFINLYKNLISDFSSKNSLSKRGFGTDIAL